MNPMKRTGLKLLGLCVLALGLMAFSATAAQAQGNWMVKGANLTSGSKELKGELVSPDGKLLVTLGLNKITLACTAGSLVNANLEADGAVSQASKNAKVKFSGCAMEVNGKVAAKCEPVNGTEKGVIVTKEVYALLTAHSPTGEGVTEIVPKTGNVFAILQLGAGCFIGEELKVFEKLAVKDSAGTKEGLEKEATIHTIEEFAALTELKVGNESSESKATLDGKAEVELTSGEVWNGLPPRIVNSININPFDLEAEVIAGGGGGTCKVGAVFAALAACTTAAGTVTWKSL